MNEQKEKPDSGEAADPADQERESAGAGSIAGSLTLDASQVEDVFEGAEPWDPIETKVVLGSLAAAVFFLVVLGYLINVYVLG